MGLGKITKLSFEALKEKADDVLAKDDVDKEDIADILQCLISFMQEKELKRAAGKDAFWFNLAIPILNSWIGKLRS